MSQFAHFSDQELFQYMRGLGLSPGPITPSTRSIYEKKLASHLTTGHVVSQSSVASQVHSSSPSLNRSSSSTSRASRSSTSPSESPTSAGRMTDDELFEQLKSLGLNPGPITPTTRSVYEKKLAKFMREVKIPGQPNRLALPVTESPTTTRVYRTTARVSPSTANSTRVSPTVVVPVQIKVNVEHDQVTASKEDRSVPIKTNRPSGKYGLNREDYDEDDEDYYEDKTTTKPPVRVQPTKPARTPESTSSTYNPTVTPTPAPQVHSAKDFPLEFKLIQDNFTPLSGMSKSASSSLSDKKRSEERSFSTYSFMKTSNFNSIPSPPYHPAKTKYHESYIDHMNNSNEIEAPGIKKRNLLPFDPNSLQPQNEHHHHYHHHHQYPPSSQNTSTSSLYPDLSQYRQQSSSLYTQPVPAQPRFNHSSIQSNSIYRYVSQNWLFALLALFCIAVIYNFLMSANSTHNPII